MPNQNMSGGKESGQGRSRRGFAAMDEQKQREIASLGGRAAHRSGNAHEFTSEEARAAGRKGGEAVSQNRDHMATIGARGGEASGGARGRQASGGRELDDRGVDS
jgi:general stress protein YciG